QIFNLSIRESLQVATPGLRLSLTSRTLWNSGDTWTVDKKSTNSLAPSMGRRAREKK
ncbi:hypothetical protein TorRG33x02_188150, partial [Trema orientale]